MDGIYTMASPSSSSLYGNVGCAIRELIISKFPYNYFNYTNVSTEVAFHNLRRQFGSNTKTEITKRGYPQLIIQPSYQIMDEDEFLQGIPLTKNYMDIQNRVDNQYLFEVIHDEEHNWALKFKPNRDRIEYEVTIRVKTIHNQLDIYKAMVNQITWDNYQYYSAALETILPKRMVEYMSRLCNIDIYTYPELIPTFLKHLNSLSGYPITYKVRNASATDEFFMYYQHNLLVSFTDLQIDNGNKKGMVDDYYEITFRVNVEFNLPGLFILDGDVNNIPMLQAGIIDKSSTGTGFDSDKDDYIPLFSISNFYNKFPQRRDGLTLYGSFMFTCENKELTDTIDLKMLIEEQHRKAIRFHVSYGMIDETICKVYILKNREELSSDNYTVNWNTMEIEYKNPDPTATYRVVIYMNMEVINADLANPRIDGPYDKSSLRENVVDYSDTMNKHMIDMDREDQDTDFNVTFSGVITNRELPGVFLGEDLDESRVGTRDIVAMPTSRDDEDMWHAFSTNPRGNTFENIEGITDQMAATAALTADADGNLKAVGSIEIESDTEENNDPPVESEEDKKEVIMKYYSSIFDKSTNMKAEKEEPVKKYKWQSSTSDQLIEEKIKFTDSLDPIHIDAINTWSKIIGNAMLYNYASLFAIEESNNYALNTDGKYEAVTEDTPKLMYED